MEIKLWGVRGSIPSPPDNQNFRGKLHQILAQSRGVELETPDQIDRYIDALPEHLQYYYGGDTTCITVDAGGDNFFIIDAGTGIRRLGYELMKGPAGKGEGNLKILFTHTHWDHIQGLPFFIPMYVPGNQLHFYSAIEDLQERLSLQMTDRYFPATFDGTKSNKNYIHLREAETLHMPDGLEIDILPVRHPGGCHAYRFRQGGKTFIFSTDTELLGDDLMNEQYAAFYRDADILILDAQYTLDEAFLKFDWGHTGFTMAVNCAVHWNIKQLYLTHHEPAYDDLTLYTNLNNSIAHRGLLGKEVPEIHMAREGMELHLT